MELNPTYFTSITLHKSERIHVSKRPCSNAMINVCLTTNDAVVSHLKTSRTTNSTLCSPRFTQQDPLLGCKEAAALIYIPWQAANCLKHQTTQYCLLFDLNILNKFSQENPLFAFSLSSLTHCHSGHS